MPGRLFLTRPLDEITHAGHAAATLAPEPPRRNIAPGQEVIALSPDGFRRMRWGMIPVGRVNARGRPVMETIVNARSETLFDKSAFAGVARAVVPVDGWYEWTGEKRRKTAWAIRPKDGTLLWFAAIRDVWTAPGGTVLAQVATVTCAPNQDVAPIHHRMGVLLAPDDISVWLTGSETAARALCNPWPEGRLQITEATDVDWTQP